MTKELMETIEAIESVKAAMGALIAEDKIEEASAKSAELDSLEKKFELLNKIGEMPEKGQVENMGAEALTPAQDRDIVDSVKEFADAARHGFVNLNKEGSNADGGYTVPADIQTKINRFKEESFSLQSLVSTESVTAPTGARTYITKTQHTGFIAVGEGTAIGAKDGPKFERIEYSVKKYAGYLPVTNELLADSDDNISNVLIEWLGKEDIATRNSLIINKIKTDYTAKAAAGIDDIKGFITKDLGSAYAGSAKIVTNDSGLAYLDSLKDKNDRPLLTPNANGNDPLDMTLAVGARRVPLVVVPDSVLPLDGTDLPFIIGDLKEAIHIYERAGISIMTSNTAAVGSLNAYEQDLTLFRAVERLDVQSVDKSALVYAKLTPAKA